LAPRGRRPMFHVKRLLQLEPRPAKLPPGRRWRPRPPRSMGCQVVASPLHHLPPFLAKRKGSTGQQAPCSRVPETGRHSRWSAVCWPSARSSRALRWLGPGLPPPSHRRRLPWMPRRHRVRGVASPRCSTGHRTAPDRPPESHGRPHAAGAEGHLLARVRQRPSRGPLRRGVASEGPALVAVPARRPQPCPRFLPRPELPPGSATASAALALSTAPARRPTRTPARRRPRSRPPADRRPRAHPPPVPPHRARSPRRSGVPVHARTRPCPEPVRRIAVAPRTSPRRAGWPRGRRGAPCRSASPAPPGPSLVRDPRRRTRCPDGAQRASPALRLVRQGRHLGAPDLAA